jgi:putative ABC transport system permease protein
VFFDFWGEIYEYIKRKPQKVIVSSIGIVWGIFILTLLIGVGNGFERGVFKVFSGFAVNSTYIFASETSVEYKGTAINKKIFLNEMDLDILKKTVPEIIHISPEVSQRKLVLHKNKTGLFEIKGVYPAYFSIKLIETEVGRILNPLDMQKNRKTALIGENVVEVLFKDQNPIGEMIQIDREIFQVVGTIKNTILNSSEERAIYIPFSTYLSILYDAQNFSTVVYNQEETMNSKKIQLNIRSRMARKYQFSPDDDNVFYFNSIEDQVKAFSELFSTLKKFLWFMGISTLIGGIIGIGNIMYATTKERTMEIGIRKAIGAKPSEIRGMIMGEAIALTSVAGSLGLILGWSILEIIGLFIDEDSLIMGKPSIDIITVIVALLILIISGTLAGLIPAIYASELQPIDALREDN